MQIHQIIPIHKKKKSKRIGRGGKRGTYSGKGMKGQLARAGRKLRPEERDIIKKVPKKRGYREGPFLAHIPTEVSLSRIEDVFNDGEIVSKDTLIAKKVIREKQVRSSRIKILGSGPLSKKLIVSGCMLSKSARGAIEKAGGSVR